MLTRIDILVSAIAAESGLDPDRVAQDKIHILRFINDTRREVSELPVQFQQLEFLGEVVGIVQTTAGTVKATIGQSEITGTTTSFATAMAGRQMKIGTASWRRISFVSDTTHLTLESGWPDDTVTDQTYRIWQKHIPLPPKIDKLLQVKEYTNNVPLTFYDQNEFYAKFGKDDDTGTPHSYTVYGSTDFGLDYLGSTVFTSVTSTANSPILDFSGTVLVTAMSPGDRIRFGDTTTATAFYVDRILTDTKVSLRGVVPQAGVLSATALSTQRKFIQVYPAIDGVKILIYTARKQMVDLVDDEDIIEEGWYSVIKKGAIAKSMGYINSDKEAQKLQEYAAEKQTLVRNQFKALNPFPRLKPYIRDRYS